MLLSPISFLNFPRFSLFPVPLSSLSACPPPSLSSHLSRHHVIPQPRCLPPPSNCRRLQQRQTAATRARERIDTRTRAHTCAHVHIPARTCTHRHGTSPRQVGIQMDTDVTAVARFSTHRPLRSPLAPLLPAPARTPLDSLFFSFPLAPARHLLSGMSARW